MTHRGLTGEEAFWHACTGTPIDEESARSNVFTITQIMRRLAMDDYILVFNTGVSAAVEKLAVTEYNLRVGTKIRSNHPLHHAIQETHDHVVAMRVGPRQA